MLARVQVLEFKAAGASLRYRVYGQGDPVVLVHGLSGSRHWWNYNIPALAQHYRVYVPDLSGYGRAWRQRSLSVAENAALLAAWLDSLGLPSVRLVGHSMGGQICLRLTESRPDLVSRLVLACASGLVEGDLWRLAARRLPRAMVTGRPSFVPRILLDSARAGLPNVWRSGTLLLRDNVTTLLPLLQVPTLVVWGERDALVPAELGRQLAASIPGAIYHEIPHAGHVVMVDAPAEFNRLVLDFLGSRP